MDDMERALDAFADEGYTHAAATIREHIAALTAEVAALKRDAEIGAVVWRYIDRMNDVCPEYDPADKIVAEFVAAVMPLMLAKIAARQEAT